MTTERATYRNHEGHAEANPAKTGYRVYRQE
jgi:hypothetical protein